MKMQTLLFALFAMFVFRALLAPDRANAEKAVVTQPASQPVPVLLESATKIATGSRHTCALTTSGGVKCWGDSSAGQLGNNSTTNSSIPVDVNGLTSGVSAIAAGGFHTCALTASGDVKCRGQNFYGQLGDGTRIDHSTPVDVSGLSGVIAVAAGWQHTCALTVNVGAKCWGRNNLGQLGDGTTTEERLIPVDVRGLTSDETEIGLGGAHTCALTTGGGAKCWGYNYYNQLGDGTGINYSTPVDVSGLTNGVISITAGNAHTCAVMMNYDGKCWCQNWYGQLGDDTTTDRATPVDVSGLSSEVSAIAPGESHTCALMTGGGIKCWGLNTYGELGDGGGGVPCKCTVLGMPGESDERQSVAAVT